MAHWAEQALPTPEFRGLNPVIGKICAELGFTVNCWKDNLFAWWWSNGKSVHILLQQSEFESRWIEKSKKNMCPGWSNQKNRDSEVLRLRCWHTNIRVFNQLIKMKINFKIGQIVRQGSFLFISAFFQVCGIRTYDSQSSIFVKSWEFWTQTHAFTTKKQSS